MAVRLSALSSGRRFTPEESHFYASDSHFCKRISKSQGLVQPEVLVKFVKINYFFGSRALGLSA
jgi:hypothetical protein